MRSTRGYGCLDLVRVARVTEEMACVAGWDVVRIQLHSGLSRGFRLRAGLAIDQSRPQPAVGLDNQRDPI